MELRKACWESAVPEIVKHNGEYYIISLKETLNGIKAAKHKFEKIEHNETKEIYWERWIKYSGSLDGIIQIIRTG